VYQGGHSTTGAVTTTTGLKVTVAFDTTPIAVGTRVRTQGEISLKTNYVMTSGVVWASVQQYDPP